MIETLEKACQTRTAETSSSYTESTSECAVATLTFTGRRSDPETGLMQYRTRYYSPGLGRFVSRDKRHAPNMYGYVRHNSLKFADPFGLEAIHLELPGTTSVEIDVDSDELVKQLEDTYGDDKCLVATDIVLKIRREEYLKIYSKFLGIGPLPGEEEPLIPVGGGTADVFVRELPVRSVPILSNLNTCPPCPKCRAMMRMQGWSIQVSSEIHEVVPIPEYEVWKEQFEHDIGAEWWTYYWVEGLLTGDLLIVCYLETSSE